MLYIIMRLPDIITHYRQILGNANTRHEDGYLEIPKIIVVAPVRRVYPRINRILDSRLHIDS